MDFQIRDAKTENEKAAVRDLLCDGFDVRPGLGQAFVRLYDGVLDTPVRSRIAVCQAQVIGHALLVVRDFVFSGVSISGGIVAMVVVDEAFRGQGVARALVADLEGVARVEGIRVLHVAGDPRFYTKLGFVPAYVEGLAELSISDDATGACLRVALQDDVSVLCELAQSEVLTGSVWADAKRWAWVLKTGHPREMVMCNDQLLGIRAVDDACWILDALGYVRACWSDDVLVIYEAGCVDDRSAERVLHACLAKGAEKGCQQMRLFLSPQCRLVKAAMRQNVDVRIHEDHELQARVLDWASLLTDMVSVFEARVLGQFLGRIGLSIGRDQVILSLGKEVMVERVEVMRDVDWHLVVSEAAMTRFVLGMDTFCDPEGNVLLDQILACLFPKQHPFIGLADSF